MKERSILCLVLIAASAASVVAQTTTVNWNNSSFDAGTQSSLLLRNSAGTPLSQGTANVNTDGFLVQLGYFSAATPGNNFAGTWIPLTGSGATLRTTIGDSFDLAGSGNGVINFNTSFSLNTAAVAVFFSGEPGAYSTLSSVNITASTPPSNQVLSIRFYDSTTNTNFNTVSANDWVWKTPTASGSLVSINLESAFLGLGNAQPLIWESVQVFGLTGTEFRTVLVPEPSTWLLLPLGLATLGLVRRRARSAP